MRPPDLPGGNARVWVQPRLLIRASMRPPDLPGGNCLSSGKTFRETLRFNEAAGFTRRKPVILDEVSVYMIGASMRPPDLPGGNE